MYFYTHISDFCNAEHKGIKMKKRNFNDIFKNAAGTIFLFAAAFFVFSTLVSMRAVLADPVIIQQQQQAVSNSPRSVRTAKASSSRTSRTSRDSKAIVARTGATQTTKSAPATAVSAYRGTASRGTASRSSVAGTTAATSARGVSARSATNRATATNKSVRSRTAVSSANASRVSLLGTAIRGSNSSTSYTYLSNKLYTGTYSNIIDTDTGLISNEAYNKCKESYYACMDEICTARNAAQRRCACAGRVKAFATAEDALETANEELIKVSGELALLLATNGKDVSAAFELTDAEKVMNCVSWQEANKNGKADSDDMTEWCENHSIYDNSCGVNNSPEYCDSSNNSFGFDIDNLDGSSSDILASLKSWADAKDATLTITTDDDDALSNALTTISDVVGDLSGLTTSLTGDEDLTDSLAETWGYELFEYAHNNVCNRVLDSCFNGIFEACGVPGDTGRDCTNNSSTCPYNYNTYITVTNTGTYELDFVTGTSGTSSSASCYGYSSSTDPYEDLRGPVADARRSVLQKYALDANADCDAYGAELEDQATSIQYQKAAAQQALQQKRLEFYQDEESEKDSAIASAKENYLKCLDEIQDCRIDAYNSYHDSKGWSYNRIISYCNTMSNVETCYETMVCDQSAEEVITSDDATESNSTKIQNVVTLSDILALNDNTSRSDCLNSDLSVAEVRNYGSEDNTNEWCKPTNGTNGYKVWNSTNAQWGECQATACNTGYHVETNTAGNKVCVLPDNAYADLTATATGLFVPAIGARCNSGYIVSGVDCVSAACPSASLYDTTCTTVSADGTVAGCAKIGCKCITDTETSSGLCI